MAGRTHVIARTFDRVCAVLDQLGYTEGDTVTAEGRLLAGLYTELDLLVAECLRRGLWDGLAPAELAACVSALTFESRRPDDASPPRLPHGRSARGARGHDQGVGRARRRRKGASAVVPARARPGVRLDRARLGQGPALEQVLSGDLTPGDFVRAVKQLIDLLDQIAAAARAAPSPTRPAARSAALRRGVVAYSSVG